MRKLFITLALALALTGCSLGIGPAGLARPQPTPTDPPVGDTIAVHAFRRDELMRFDVVLDAPAASEATLTASAAETELRRGWLGAATSTRPGATMKPGAAVRSAGRARPSAAREGGA